MCDEKCPPETFCPICYSSRKQAKLIYRKQRLDWLRYMKSIGEKHKGKKN